MHRMDWIRKMGFASVFMKAASPLGGCDKGHQLTVACDEVIITCYIRYVHACERSAHAMSR